MKRWRWQSSYSAYLWTRRWRRFRARIIEQRSPRCQYCGSRVDIEVHHLTYERLGRERPGDVLVLCNPCHEFIHNNDEVRDALMVLLLPTFKGWEKPGSPILGRVLGVVREAVARNGWTPPHLVPKAEIFTGPNSITGWLDT